MSVPAEMGHPAPGDVSAAIREFGRRKQGLCSVDELRNAGVSTWSLSRAVRAGTVVRLCHRVYALEPAVPLPRFIVTDEGPSPTYVRRVRTALLSLGEDATAIGTTAAALRGWGLLVEPGGIVDAAAPHHRTRASRADVRVERRRQLDRELVQVLPGTAAMAVTSAVQTLLDCAIVLPLVEAVVVCDSALRAGAVTVDQVREACGPRRGTVGGRRLAKVLAYCDPASGSVLESVQRMLMILAGLTGFSTQHIVRDRDGRFLMRVDFAFEAERVIVEVDGFRWHPDGHLDRRRDNVLAGLGWRVLRFSWAEVIHEPQRVLADIAAALTWWRAA